MQRPAALADALLAGAEGAKVLGSLRVDGGEELKHDALGGLTPDRDVEEDGRVGHATSLLEGDGRPRVLLPKEAERSHAGVAKREREDAIGGGLQKGHRRLLAHREELELEDEHRAGRDARWHARLAVPERGRQEELPLVAGTHHLQRQRPAGDDFARLEGGRPAARVRRVEDAAVDQPALVVALAQRVCIWTLTRAAARLEHAVLQPGRELDEVRVAALVVLEPVGAAAGGGTCEEAD
mmetsp:Transcript_32900/g.105753  ORF Transcript_32900/g.105753 Transcript_32900/m.105753 type:complete len:239 (-) Transcript_32900:48-764(-)